MLWQAPLRAERKVESCFRFVGYEVFFQFGELGIGVDGVFLYDIIAEVGGIFGHKCEVYSFGLLEGLLEDGTLSDAVDTTEDIDVSVKMPQDMLSLSPKGINLNCFDVFCVFHIKSKVKGLRSKV